MARGAAGLKAASGKPVRALSKQNQNTHAAWRRNQLLFLQNKRKSFAQGNVTMTCNCSALAATFFLLSHRPIFFYSVVHSRGCVLCAGNI